MTDSRIAHLPEATFTQVRRYLWQVIASRAGTFTGICALHGAAALAGLIAPFVLGRIIDRVTAGESLPLFTLAGIVLMGLALQAGFGYLSVSWSFAVGEEIFDKLRRSFFDALLALPVPFAERVPTGELVSRSTSDMDAVQEIARVGLPEFVVGAVSVSVTVVAAFWVNPVVAMGMLVGVPLLFFAKRRYAKKAPRLYVRELRARAGLGSLHADTVAGADEVANFNLGRRRRTLLVDGAKELRNATAATIRFERSSFPVVQAGYHLPLFGVLMIGSLAAGQDMATLGEVATIAMFTRVVLAPLDDVMYWFNEAFSSGAATSRILGVVVDGRRTRDADGSGLGDDDAVNSSSADAPESSPTHASAALRVRSAYFVYEGASHAAVQGVDMDLEPGKKYGVVGRSGAGKSTLALMIAGVLDTQPGTLSIMDSTGAVMTGDEAGVTLVTQHDHVFMGSVRDNLVFVASGATDEQVWAALTAINADGWVRGLDGGLDAVLGVNGYVPSPAESRQLSLARVFLMRPALLLLDEATAALPPAERRAFSAALKHDLRASTVLHVAHDLDVAEDCDHIFVMEGGRIVEQGAPEKLRLEDGYFRRLHDAAVRP